jgi:hypothetical protein
MSRPVEYGPEVLRLANEYLEQYPQNKQLVPTVVGLCKHINRSKSTVYEWEKHADKSEFSDILTRIAEIQEMELINGGLGGLFNPAITKMMLTKHGYSDKQELDHTSSDGSMRPTVLVSFDNDQTDQD